MKEVLNTVIPEDRDIRGSGNLSSGGLLVGDEQVSVMSPNWGVVGKINCIGTPNNTSERV